MPDLVSPDRLTAKGGVVMATVSPPRCRVFDRILCAVDGSEHSLEAARQAHALRAKDGTIELDCVFKQPAVAYSPYGGAAITDEAEEKAASMLAAAKSSCPEATAHLLHGATVARLLERIQECNATLIAVGATERHRGLGVVRGSVAAAMLHTAPSSVLVARPPDEPDAFPRAVVVGFDGSPAAWRALDAARAICDRKEAEVTLRIVAAGTPSPVDPALLDELAAEHDERQPLEALLDASHEADLLVVGSRGLRALRALSSVSERIGHQATCSVLVVR
jgi:nucleotide-binding universal stress UspA family protein